MWIYDICIMFGFLGGMSQQLIGFISFSSHGIQCRVYVYYMHVYMPYKDTKYETQANAVFVTCFCPEFGQMFSSEGQVSYLGLGGR